MATVEGASREQRGASWWAWQTRGLNIGQSWVQYVNNRSVKGAVWDFRLSPTNYAWNISRISEREEDGIVRTARGAGFLISSIQPVGSRGQRVRRRARADA